MGSNVSELMTVDCRNPSTGGGPGHTTGMSASLIGQVSQARQTGRYVSDGRGTRHVHRAAQFGSLVGAPGGRRGQLP